jgi:hypothetical protein
LGLLLAPIAVSVAHAADTPPDDEGNLSVVVTDGQPGVPSPSTSRQGSGSNGAGVPAGSGGPAPGEVSLGGMLYLGGLNSAVALSANPGEGDVTMWFTLRNASKSAIDATADFWMDHVFGGRVDSADGVAISALQPGETRVVTAQLHHAGQWTLLDAHVTLTPPESVDGTPLTPVTRDATILVFPWLIVSAIALVVIAYFVLRALRAAVPVPPVADLA